MVFCATFEIQFINRILNPDIESVFSFDNESIVHIREVGIAIFNFQKPFYFFEMHISEDYIFKQIPKFIKMDLF